jgi:hypothetical protein
MAHRMSNSWKIPSNIGVREKRWRFVYHEGLRLGRWRCPLTFATTARRLVGIDPGTAREGVLLDRLACPGNSDKLDRLLCVSR